MAGRRLAWTLLLAGIETAASALSWALHILSTRPDLQHGSSRRTTSGTTTIGDHRIAAGTTILYSPYLLHHRADLYPDPERFDPDRWDQQRPGPQLRHAYVAFGDGARRCIGDAYAITLTNLALASIAARWHLAPASKRPVRPAAKAILSPSNCT